MRADKRVIISLAVSVGFHALLLLTSANTKLFGRFKEEEKKDRLFIVKTVKPKENLTKDFHQSELTAEEAVKFQKPSFIDDGGSTSNQQELADKKNTEINLEKEVFISKLAESPSSLLKDIEKDSKYLKKKEERQTRPEIFNVTMDQTINELEDYIQTVDVSDDFVDRMPGFTPGYFSQSDSLPTSNAAGGMLGDKDSVIRRTLTSEQVDKLFGGDVLVYEDAQDGHKYFQLRISAALDETLLPVIPKDIIFLIDCSISIEQDRLDQFKEGVRHSLTHLNKGDYFNIIAFKEKADKFQESPVEPTKENISGALNFISRLTSGEKTDTYSALYNSINFKDTQRPTYIVLLSDGRPTQGVTDTQALINKISKENNGKASIFAFSGGSWVNRYLLDFIAYKNRGWAEYSSRSQYIGKSLGEMYDKIRNPVLLNLRYYASGINIKEIFPQNLPDLYQNVEFTLYGQFKDEDKFVFQLNSSVDGKTKTYTMSRSLKDAPKGGADIARNWAFNKIYHLIGQLKEGNENKAIIEQINGLSKKYNIKTPYQKKMWTNKP